MPRLGQKYDIEIETISKAREEYMTDEYFELDLPVAPAVMVADEIVVVAIGIPVAAVLVFEALLNSLAMFNHGNVLLPLTIDRVLRYGIVTPDMHRVHHSVIIRETNSNFGFNLSCWDRLFGTYCEQPARGHNGMVIGLSQFRVAQKLGLTRLLILPFIGDPGKYPINRH